MSDSSGDSGCLSILVQIIMAIFSMVFFAESASTIEVMPPTDAISIEIQLVPETATSDSEMLQVAVNVLDQRLVNLGVIDYEVVIEDSSIVARMDTYLELDLIMNVLSTTGYLEFVDFSGLGEQISQYEGATILTTGQIELFGDGGIAGNGVAYPVTGEAFVTVLTSDDIQIASSQYDANFGNYFVEVNFTETGGAKLGDYTEANIGEPLAIVLDGVVLSAPIVQSRLDTAAIITGNFTEAETLVLAAQLNSEVLPIPLTIQAINSLD